MKIRAGVEEDHDPLLELWRRSVQATHHFLTAEDIDYFYPRVRDEALPNLELWVLLTNDEQLAGFMGMNGSHVDALFLDPGSLRQGGGRLLIEHARELKGRLEVDVNEHNGEALAFYQAMGFIVHGRSELDSTGRPFPLLHMREAE